MRARIEPIYKARKSHAKRLQSLRTAAPETGLLPDLVEPSWIAPVTLDEVASPHPQPACNPDIDRIGFRERAARDGGGRRGKKCGGHEGLIDFDLTQAAKAD